MTRALLSSLLLAYRGNKLHGNAARPLLALKLIARGEHRDWVTKRGMRVLRYHFPGDVLSDAAIHSVRTKEEPDDE